MEDISSYNQNNVFYIFLFVFPRYPTSVPITLLWGNRTFEAFSFDFWLIKLEIEMCFCKCVSECVSANVFPRMCFQFAFSLLFA